MIKDKRVITNDSKRCSIQMNRRLLHQAHFYYENVVVGLRVNNDFDVVGLLDIRIKSYNL